MRHKGLVHLYIGSGKGKTSAALGLALRAHGADKRVCFIQFLKAMRSSEIVVLKRLNIATVLFKEKHPLFYKSVFVEALKKRVLRDLQKTQEFLRDKRYNFIVLDEILYLLKDRLIKEEDILRIIKSKAQQTELILTGGVATKRIIKMADYVTSFTKIKHPFKKGICARYGIEY